MKLSARLQLRSLFLISCCALFGCMAPHGVSTGHFVLKRVTFFSSGRKDIHVSGTLFPALAIYMEKRHWHPRPLQSGDGDGGWSPIHPYYFVYFEGVRTSDGARVVYDYVLNDDLLPDNEDRDSSEAFRAMSIEMQRVAKLKIPVNPKTGFR